MKAILVIDIPDEVGIDKLSANVYVNKIKDCGYDYEPYTFQFYCSLRPLPERMSKETPATDFTHPLTIFSQGMHDGWNDCLDAITGEKE